VTYPPYRKLRKSTKNKMKSRLKYLQRKYHEEEVDINDINASVQSYMGILDHCSSYNLKKRTIGKLDKEILDQLDLDEELELKS
jgi:hypothetical protein